MTFWRHFLPVLVLPLTVCLIALIVGHLRRWRRVVWAAIVLLWIGSTPIFAGFLARAVEGSAERKAARDAPAADAIVVLSGARIIAPGPAAISEWVEADRFFGGVELFQAGKAPLLVFTGARPIGPAGAPLEGQTLSTFAAAFGVPADRIVTTGLVTNTEDEAREVAALLRMRRPGPTRVLLITSAYHMPRAQRLFERAGLVVVPFPVDFQHAAGASVGVIDFLPSPSALQETQMMFLELYGRLFYRVLGS